MGLALDEARLALDAGEFPVGCVLIEDGLVLARGHRQNSGGGGANEIDHAEILTLRSLLAAESGRDCSRITLFSTMEPCLMCYATALLSGIRSFVYAYEDIMGGGSGLNLQQLPELYRAMDVEIRPAVRRTESLEMFQDFFHSHDYWQNSLLAKYTAEQKTENRGQ